MAHGRLRPPRRRLRDRPLNAVTSWLAEFALYFVGITAFASLTNGAFDAFHHGGGLWIHTRRWLRSTMILTFAVLAAHEIGAAHGLSLIGD